MKSILTTEKMIWILGNFTKGNMKLKTFKDLIFEEHQLSKKLKQSGTYLNNFIGCTQAVLDFPNGYGISVITGSCFYTNQNQPYECAVLKDGHLCYDTLITDDVIGHYNESGVNEIMRQIQKLPKVEK